MPSRAKRARIRRAQTRSVNGLGSQGGAAAIEKEAANPFAQHRNARVKHDVLNRRVRGGERNMAVARSKAVARRSQTLLQEYKQSGKANSFQDRRFGEMTDGISHEEKMLHRLVKARTKQARRKSVFNLNDDEGETDVVLTHFGRDVRDLAGHDVDMGADEFDKGLEADIVDNLHFGQGDIPRRGSAPVPHWMKHQDTNPNRPRTHKEVMMEVIAKAKFHKAQRAREKREQEDLLDQLDDKSNLDVVRSLLVSNPRKGKKGGDKTAAGGSKEDEVPPWRRDRDAGGADAGGAEEEDAAGFSYDRTVREISQEARAAKPSDRLKTDAEVAREELERLQKLEEARKKRMAMDATGDDDDLAVNYEIDNSMYDDGASSGEDSLASFDSRRGEGAPESDDSEDDSDAEVDVEEVEGGAAKQAVGDMPFLVQCPKTLAGWNTLVRRYGGTATTVAELIRRIRTRYSGHLSSEHEPKLATLYRVLLEFVASLPGDHGDDGAVHMGNVVLPALYELSQSNTAARAAAWKAQLTAMHTRVAKRVAKGSADAWLSVGEVMLLRMATHIFPPTDYRHPVLTPCTLLVGRVLMQCPVSTPADVAAGLRCCALMIELTTEAGRVAPEVLVFLHGVLSAACHPSHAEAAATAVSLPALLTSRGLSSLAWLRRGVLAWRTALNSLYVEAGVAPLSALPMASLSQATYGGGASGAAVATPSECAGLLSTCVKLLQRAAESVSGVDACPELLYPSWLATSHLLPLSSAATKKSKKKSKKKKKKKKGKKGAASSASEDDTFSDPLTGLIEETVAGLDTLMKTADEARGALRLQQVAMKPKAIRTYDPLFEDEFQPSANLKPTDPKAALRKLQREVRKEQKGVARELRKDAQFLARVRDEELAKRDAEREAKTKEVMAFLEQQQATFNQMVKEGVAKGGGSHIPVTKADRRKRKRGM